MPDFLKLLTTALLQINSGNNNPIPLKSYSDPASPKDSVISGDMLKSEYLKIANDVKNYMNSSGKAPYYAYKTSLGTYFGYQNLIYTFSKILSFQKTNNYLLSYVSVKPWNFIGSTPVPASLLKYLAATTNCQVNDPKIRALAATITSTKITTYGKAVAIFNWVRDNLGYSFYYNTKYGAVGA